MARNKGSHTQAVRLSRILDQLQGHRVGVRLVDLEETHGISRSQLRRDLLALEEAGIRLETEQEHGRYGHTKVRIADTGSAKIELNLSERYTLLGARDFFRFFTGASLHADMETIVDKVVATMPVGTKRHTRSMERKIHFRPQGGTKTYEGKEDILNALLTGVLFERYVDFTYKPRSGRQTEDTFAPYAMVIHRNGLYVVAQRIQEPGAKRRQKPRVFAGGADRRNKRACASSRSASTADGGWIACANGSSRRPTQPLRRHREAGRRSPRAPHRETPEAPSGAVPRLRVRGLPNVDPFRNGVTNMRRALSCNVAAAARANARPTCNCPTSRI